MHLARMLGNRVERLAQRKGLTISDMAQVMGCSEIQVQRFLKGFVYASFRQIEAIAAALGVSVQDLLKEDVECQEKTSDDAEMILDIIHDYVDITDAVNAAEGESVK